MTRIDDDLKLHRRRLRLDGRDFTVITLRPGTDARFSTNYFHETWHVLSDWHGAKLLGLLLWGLAYQRRPGTLVLIDRPFLDPNPFDAEPADPIALVPAQLTPLSHKAARELRRRLPLREPPDGTVRWHVSGLAAAVKWRRRPNYGERMVLYRTGWDQRVSRVGGLVTFAAMPDMLKVNAAGVYTLGDRPFCNGMDYADVDRWNGEVQVFRDYRHRVTAARLARQAVLAELPVPLPPADLNPLIWRRTHEILHRLQWTDVAPVVASVGRGNYPRNYTN